MRVTIVTPCAVVLLITLCTFMAYAEQYVVQDIGSFTPTDISESGMVAGYIPGSPSIAVCYDKEGGSKLLGALPGHASSKAYAINESGQVAGLSWTDGGASANLVLWTEGTLHDLGTIEAPTDLVRINDLSMVYGVRQNQSGDPVVYLWDSSNGLEDIATVESSAALTVYDMNDAGQLVGSIAEGPSGFIWSPDSGLQKIPPLTEGGTTFFTAIAANALIAGVGTSTERPFGLIKYSESSGYWQLPHLQDHTFHTPEAIATTGEVIGTALNSGNEPTYFIWEDSRGTKDIQDLLPPNSTWTVTGLVDLSSNGTNLLATGQQETANRALILIMHYDLEVTMEGAGSVSPDENNRSFEHGATAIIQAIPAEGWQFERWEGVDTPFLNPTGVQMFQDRQVKAIFALLPPVQDTDGGPQCAATTGFPGSNTTPPAGFIVAITGLSLIAVMMRRRYA